MANLDLDSAIRSIVSDEVERTLEPYRSLLDRMSGFFGGEPVRRGPGRPPKAPGAVSAPLAPRREGRGRRAAAPAAGGDVSRFHDGQAVRYKQGRGVFDATVIGIDAARSLLTLERSMDGKKVERPAAKVYEA